MVDLAHLTLAGASRAIAAGQLSSVELVEATLARIEAHDAWLNSHVTVMAESALADARAADTEIAAGRRRGPLHGVTVALKDIYDTAGVLTAGGSKTRQDRVPAEDAETVRRLRAAGAVITGKLATHEFAHGGPSFDLPWPPARNPWNTDHFSGGSSSGSGVAVAAGLCLGALGTDTGGSIRGPAALSGVAGLMPSYGLVSRRGVIPNSFTFDHCGPLAWTAEDCALLLDALAGHDPEDPRSSTRPQRPAPPSMAGLRVGLLRHYWEEDLTCAPEMVAACEHMADVFRSLGASVETTRMPPVQDWYDVKITIAESELFNVHRRDLQTRPRDFGQDFLSRALGAVCYTSQDYIAAHRRWRQLRRAMEPVYERFDILIAPSATGPAPRLDAHNTASFWLYPSITTPFDVTGGPALTITAGFSESGLPLGVQIAAAPLPRPGGAGGRPGVRGGDRMARPPTCAGGRPAAGARGGGPARARPSARGGIAGRGADARRRRRPAGRRLCTRPHSRRRPPRPRHGPPAGPGLRLRRRDLRAGAGAILRVRMEGGGREQPK